MLLLKLFSLPVFLISFAIGVLIVYLTSPPPREIMVYPTPENVGEVLYKDTANQCYQFIPNEIKCPNDDKEITSIPPQI